MNVYSGDSVTANDWNWDQDGAYGIIGMAPSSGLWESFISPSTLTAVYSIELARFTNPFSGVLKGSSSVSNITLGSANDAYYAGEASMTISALDNYTYGLNSFGFGKVYMTDGPLPTAQSAYFTEFTAGYPVEFAVNFQGMGLPSALYAEFVSNLTIVESGVSCSASDGVCNFPSVCSGHDSLLTEFQFKLAFTGSKDFLRVPLATFAYSTVGGSCALQITELDYAQDSVVLGGMFFQEFFGVFENNYTFQSGQTATIYVSRNELFSAYVGSTELPEGANPFISSSGLGTWDIVGISVGGFIVLVMAVIVIMCCLKKKTKDQQAGAVVYEDVQKEPLVVEKPAAIN
jgi:hypothetical protein